MCQGGMGGGELSAGRIFSKIKVQGKKRRKKEKGRNKAPEVG